MSRHNRRRSRGGRKHATPSRAATSHMSEDGSDSITSFSFPGPESDASRTSSPSPIPDFVERIPQLPPSMPMPRSSAPSVRVWHNRYLAWQARKQQAEQIAATLSGQRCGFGGLPPTNLDTFGGDLDDDSGSNPDEDQELDTKMNDYFRGLDWLV